MPRQNTRSSSRPVHLVLVPGFAGFDALGQLEYYASVTPLFQKWKGKNAVVLHYFDNFPTAAVVTRAHRLQKYLARRMARGEIAAGDDVVLVGHSTGGLDIRQLILHLDEHRDEPVVVDGGVEVEGETILKHIRRVVFLSVPHRGTNIADWVTGHTTWRKAIVAELRAAVAGSQAPLVDRIEDCITGAVACFTRAELFLAAQDSLREADPHNSPPNDGERIAEAHEADAALGLYLRQIASDFRAIDDLTAKCPPRGPLSPAHFDRDQRKKELALWDERRITARSYVTLGRRAFAFAPGRAAPVWELANPCTYPELTNGAICDSHTDIAYRTCYRACAGGPFNAPRRAGDVTRRLPGTAKHSIELWDNDGIVNTASMFWPRGENVLVSADHMDIVGHYKPVRAGAGAGRTYQAYDLLKSDSGFGDDTFQEVWAEIFKFGVPHTL